VHDNFILRSDGRRQNASAHLSTGSVHPHTHGSAAMDFENIAAIGARQQIVKQNTRAFFAL
jgi:hypothetical protein